MNQWPDRGEMSNILHFCNDSNETVWSKRVCVPRTPYNVAKRLVCGFDYRFPCHRNGWNVSIRACRLLLHYIIHYSNSENRYIELIIPHNIHFVLYKIIQSIQHLFTCSSVCLSLVSSLINARIRLSHRCRLSLFASTWIHVSVGHATQK